MSAMYVYAPLRVAACPFSVGEWVRQGHCECLTARCPIGSGGKVQCRV